MRSDSSMHHGQWGLGQHWATETSTPTSVLRWQGGLPFSAGRDGLQGLLRCWVWKFCAQTPTRHGPRGRRDSPGSRSCRGLGEPSSSGRRGAGPVGAQWFCTKWCGRARLMPTVRLKTAAGPALGPSEGRPSPATGAAMGACRGTVGWAESSAPVGISRALRLQSLCGRNFDVLRILGSGAPSCPG